MLVCRVYWWMLPQRVISFELIAFKRSNPAHKLWASPMELQSSSHM